ncbi:MAG: ATP-binding protein [Planctomycetia bacterium]|nr:ATP-binding protein [Planctomycetia bacterium]
MKTVLKKLLDEYYEFNLPDMVRRQTDFPMFPRKATVIIGMRRTGKTWFCYQKMKDLMAEGIDRSRILYLSFDDDRLFGFDIKDFQSILDVYYARYPENKEKTCYFFFDEIQLIDHWETFIRRLIDRENIQIVLTGSSSKLLGTEIATSLRGRTYVCEMFPLSFSEYLIAANIFSQIPDQFGSAVEAKLRNALEKYFASGGFPETIGLSVFERQILLQGYVDSVLFRDVVERYRIKNITALRYLIQEILHSPGQKFSVNKFYNSLKSLGIECDKNSLYACIDHLSDAFLFSKVPVYSKSERVRRVNPAKIYTVDTGILFTALTGNSDNNGPILENMVFNGLRRTARSIEYVQPAESGEVDFIASDHFNQSKLIQVAWSLSDRRTFERETRALIAAGESLNISDRTIITWDEEDELSNGIQIIPVWKFLLSQRF